MNQPLYDEANNKLVIGNLAWEQGIHWYDMYFDGLIDEVRIYNRALSPGELADRGHRGHSSKVRCQQT